MELRVLEYFHAQNGADRARPMEIFCRLPIKQIETSMAMYDDGSIAAEPQLAVDGLEDRWAAIIK